MANRSLRTFTVLPHLPTRLQPLQKVAYNLWWCWNHEAVALFRRIDDDLFEALDNSPVKSIRYRPSWHKYVYGVFVFFFLILGYLGAQPPSEVGNYVSQIGTLIYFAFFLLMPWWSQMGTFKPVPDRVTFRAH